MIQASTSCSHLSLFFFSVQATKLIYKSNAGSVGDERDQERRSEARIRGESVGILAFVVCFTRDRYTGC